MFFFPLILLSLSPSAGDGGVWMSMKQMIYTYHTAKTGYIQFDIDIDQIKTKQQKREITAN